MPPACADHVRSLSLGDELGRWRSTIRDTFVALEPVPTGGQPFLGNITTRSLSGLAVSRIAVAGHSVRRGRTELMHSQSDTVYLVRQMAGSSAVSVGGAELRVETGDFILVDPNQAYELHFAGACRQLCIQVPGPWLRARDIHDLAPAIGRRLAGTNAVARVLGSATDALLSGPAAGADADDAVELFMDVLEHALLRLRRGTVDAQVRVRPEAASLRRFVDANFRREGLSPVDAATALGCSLRTVHTLSNELGTTFHRLLTARRLDEAARELAQSPGGVRIAEVAYRSGFGDVSAFCRSFRTRFEVSASAYRELACPEG